MNVTVMSYTDRLDIGVLACREHHPDLDVLVEALSTSLYELVAAVGEEGSAAEPGSPTPVAR